MSKHGTTAEALAMAFKKLEDENKRLRKQFEGAMAQNYCTICGNTLDGYKPPKEKNGTPNTKNAEKGL